MEHAVETTTNSLTNVRHLLVDGVNFPRGAQSPGVQRTGLDLNHNSRSLVPCMTGNQSERAKNAIHWFGIC